MKRKIITSLLAGLMLFSCVGCQKDPDTGANNNKPGTNGVITAEDCAVWSAAATEKVLASEDVSKYADIRKDTIVLSSAKNEYESGQIVVSAKKDLSFTVSVSDLVNTSNSSQVITKDNFNVYTLTYTKVARNYYGNGAPTGWYPDGMLPQENAVEYKKNVVSAGQNGGAWISFFIPEDTAAGNYVGTASITVGKDTIKMPITLKVYDVVVPSETTMKTLFGGNGYIYAMEMDSSVEMQQKYIQFFLDHRISSTHVMLHGLDGESVAEDWYYWHKKGLSTLGIYGDTMESVKSQIMACARKSLEVGENMVEKIAYFPSDIDEPFLWQDTRKASAKVEEWGALLANIIAELEADPSFDTEFGAELIESAKGIAFVVTDYATDSYGNAHRYYDILRDQDGNPYHYPDYVSICGKPDGYASAEEMAAYYNGAEQWWYNCNDPRFPYPTYQIDDSLVSQNAISWFMGEYDIVGNLYWNTTFHMDGQSGGSTYFEDPYSNPDRGGGANGDGYLVYPGKMYGVDGPVGTIRLDAIRDGNEDYELLRVLKEKYAEKGLDAHNIIHLLTKSIYNYSTMIGDSEDFEQARERLLSLLELATSDAEVLISDIVESEVNGMKNYTLKAIVAEGTELYSDGEKLTAVNGVYTVTKGLSEDKNFFRLKAVHGAKTVEFDFYLGGKQVLYKTPNDFASYNISGVVESAALSNNYWKMSLVGERDSYKEIVFKHESVANINANTAKYIVQLYHYGFTDVSFRIYVTYEKYGKVQALTGTLKPGKNELVLDFFATANWTRNGSVKQIGISISGTNTLGIGDIIVYGV